MPRPTKPLARKTPLRSQSQLTPDKPLARRSRLAPVSAKRRAEHKASRPVVALVFERDRGCLASRRPDVCGPCSGPLTPHHVRKDSQGGAWDLDNLVSLCWAHNCVWVEGNPAEAHALGLVARRGEPITYAWERMRAAGLVDGGAA